MFDCCFTKEKNWFRYRAAAIIVEDGCVLAVTNDNEDYYYSVGGGVHMGESAEDAVLREVFEETGVHYEIDRLAVIHENFFSQKGGSLDGLECHEIAFYFLMKPKGIKEFNNKSTTLGGAEERLVWLPVDEYEKYRAFPSFMGEYLRGEHKEMVHIVTK